MNRKILSELKQALETEHEILVSELKSIAEKDTKIKEDWGARYPQFEPTEYGSHTALDIEADEVEEYEVRLEAEHSLESRLLAVTQALQRIAQGTYGKCKKCKKEIPLKRLQANPAAETCLEHVSNFKK